MKDFKEIYVDTEGVTLLVVCNSKKERDQMTEDLVSGMLRMIEWNRVKTRPLTDDELEQYRDTTIEDEIPEGILDCHLPDDGQEILIAYRKKDGSLAVGYDTCAFDGGGYYLENFGSFTDIEYWAEFPDPPEDQKAAAVGPSDEEES